MLGVVTNPCDGPVEQVMRQVADDLGVGDTFRRTPVGVFFGAAGRSGCPTPTSAATAPSAPAAPSAATAWSAAGVGAKNTLSKNYLALAERRGARIEPLRTVTSVRPVDPARPERGYRVTTEATGAWLRKDRRTVTAGQVVLAAGTWGTQRLLHTMRDRGELPRLSPRLGELTRTNSEALGGRA